MEFNPYIPLLIMAAVAMLVAIGGIVVSAILGPAKKNTSKEENYECGVDAVPSENNLLRFPVKYYLIAMTFILFDVEIVFLYPWAVSFKEVGTFGFIGMLSFLVLITLPFLYEWRRGGLDWE